MIQNDTDTKIIVVANKTFVLIYDLSSNVLNSHQIQRGKRIYCNQRLFLLYSVTKTQL